jgi:signal transduction histidine kinase
LKAIPVRLAQVFGNLLSNASRYTAQGGEIRVEARRTEASAIVTVSDNGAGIPREMLPRVFDMFAQAEGAADGGGGLGVGLALVKRLVELHRGAVSVESGGPGRGSRFTVTLPSRSSGAARRGRSARRTPRRGWIHRAGDASSWWTTIATAPRA